MPKNDSKQKTSSKTAEPEIPVNNIVRRFYIPYMFESGNGYIMIDLTRKPDTKEDINFIIDKIKEIEGVEHPIPLHWIEISA